MEARESHRERLQQFLSELKEKGLTLDDLQGENKRLDGKIERWKGNLETLSAKKHRRTR